MARVVTGARVEPGGLGGVHNQNKRNETVATTSSAANARINAGGAAGAGRPASPARFCPGSPHGDSFTSVLAPSGPPTPTNQTRPVSKDNSVSLTSTGREPAAGVAGVAAAAPAANQLSRSEQHIIKRAPVAQASNSERTVRFNPVVEILECPRRRCGGGRGSPGGSPLSPPPMLPPSPPISRRGSRPRGGGLRAAQYHRSPTPPPTHRKGARNYPTGGVGPNAAGGSGVVPGGIKGLGEGTGMGLVRNRRTLRLPSPASPTASTSNMGVAHQAPVRLAWRALAGRSAPRQAANLRPLRRRSGPGPTLATKGVRGRGQRSAYGMAVLSAGITPKPSQSNTSASTNALGAAKTQLPAPSGPTSQSTPALQPSPACSQQQGNVPLPPPSSEETNYQSANATPVDSSAVIPLPAPPPPSLTSSAQPAAPTTPTLPTDTTEARVGSAGSRGTYHTATTTVSPPTSASSNTSTRSGSEPPSGSFFGPKAVGVGLRLVAAKTSMSLATAQSTMAGVALARARAASVVARAGIIDTTPPAPPPSRGSEYSSLVANAARAGAYAAASTTVTVVNKLPREQQEDAASNSSKDSDTSSAPAMSMALMHPLPLPATAISSTRDARPPAVPLTAAAASVSAVNQRPSAAEGKATVRERVHSPSPPRVAAKGHKTVPPSTQPGSNHLISRIGAPPSQGKDSPLPSSTTIATPGTTTNKPGGDDGASTSGNSAGFSILSGVPSVTGGCLAEMLTRSRNATLAEQGEGMLRLGGGRNTAVARVEVPATWSVDAPTDDKTSKVATVDAASTERSRAAGDSIVGKSKEHISSKGFRPYSPTVRKHTAKGPKISEAKKAVARDRLSHALDERGDRTEKGERVEKVDKRVSLKDTVDHSESGNTKCLSGSSLNSMLKVAAPKGIRKKSQKRTHSVDKEQTREIVPAISVPNVIDTAPPPPPPPASATSMSPFKITRPPTAGNSGGGGGSNSGLGGCMAGALGSGGTTPGIVTGGGGISSLVRVASGSKTSRLSIAGGLDKAISITPQTSMTSQLSQPPTTVGDTTSANFDVKVGKKGKRRATEELLDAAKLGKIKVKEKKKGTTGKVTKKKDDGSRIAIKGVKDGAPRRSLSLTELGRTLRSGCWTLVEACIRGTKAAANGNPPQLTVVFRAKGSGPATPAPLFRPPPTPPAGPSTQRQWANRPTRLTSASTSSRLSVLGERSLFCRGKMGSTRGSSAGSSRDVRVRNKGCGGGGGGVGGGGVTGGSRGVRNIRRRSAQKRRPNTPARRRVPSGMVRLRGPRRGRRPSGAGLDSRGSTGSANRLRARTLHRAVLSTPSKRTTRAARSARRSNVGGGGSSQSLNGRRAVVPYLPPPTRGRCSRPLSRNYPRTR